MWGLTKIGRLEGDGASRLVQLMRIHGYNPGMEFESATVIQTAPLQIELNRDKLKLDQDDLLINEDLLPMTETVEIEGVPRTIKYPMQIKSGDTVLVANNADNGQLFYVVCKLLSFQ